MCIQESLVTDKQIALELYFENGRYRLPIEGKDYYFPTLEKVHKAFLNQNTYDTIKLTHEGKKSYLHLFMDEIEVFDTKKALRQQLSQDSQGVWAEIRNGQKHYYKEERGWMSTSYKEIAEQECLEKLQHTSTMTKALGIALGILALLPGAFEFARHLPIGTKEAAMGLIALNQKNPVLGAVGYSFIPKQAEAQALGTEFQVSPISSLWAGGWSTVFHDRPSVAPLSNGGFIVTWETDFGGYWGTQAQDRNGYGIYGKRYDHNGIAGPEFLVNTYTTTDQRYSDVAPLNDGGFVVAWYSEGQDGSPAAIYGQRYDSNGSPAGSEFRVNTYPSNVQAYPTVAPLNDGGFVVTWQSRFQDGDLYGIYAQRYDSSGAAVNGEFQVNTYTTSDQSYPSIAPLIDGGFVITWQSNGQDGSNFGIYGQRYDSSGVAAGTEFQINTYTTNEQSHPSVATLNDGSFVVTWQSYQQDTSWFGIYGRLYDSSGVAAGSEFLVNTFITRDQSDTSVAPLTDGGFVVTWQSKQRAYIDGIYAQRYDSSGAAVGTEFVVYDDSSNQYIPTVAPLNDGGFVVIWLGTGQSYEIYGQRFDASGNPIALQLPTSTIVTPTPSPTQATSSQKRPISSTEIFTSSTASPSNSPSRAQVTTESPVPSSTDSFSTSNFLTTLASDPPLPTPPVTLSSLPSSTGSITTSIIAATRSVSNPILPSVETLVYGQSYTIVVNDQIVGTYIVSGGNGSLDSSNSNVIYFDFDPSFQPEEGEIITLFNIPDEDVGLWESIEIQGESIECLEPHGYVSMKLEGSSFQISFEETTCLNMGSTMLATALPLTLN